jgi:ABC-2 type transport system permease protein
MNWEQLQALVWVRWRLTRNQFTRGGQLSAAISVLVMVFLAMGAVAIGIGGLAGGWVAGAKATPQVLLVIWDAALFAFLIFWMAGVMVEIQRSESVDLTKLLHLPVTLQQVFVLNYAASHLTPSVILFLPGILGLCAGMVLGGGPTLALLLPVALGFLFMLTAWTYCLRGWLAALLVNKRRRRAVIVWLTLILVVFGQLPNLIFNTGLFRNRNPAKTEAKAGTAPGPNAAPNKNKELVLPENFVRAHLVVPPGWVGYSALALKQHDPWPALGLAAGSVFLGVLGLRRAYRLTIRFYQGAEGGKAPRARAASVSRERRPLGTLLVERKLPGLPDDTSALALATLRSLLRAPELKMALIMPLFMGVALMAARFTAPTLGVPGFFTTGAATVAVLVAAFSVAPTMANAFGLDRDGFRALVLLPTPRHNILLAKNLAFFPIVGSIALVLLAVVTVLLRVPWDAALVGVLNAPVAFLLFCLTCNLISILAPYRFSPGTLQAKKPKVAVFVGVFITLFATPLVLLPLLVPTVLQFLFNSLGWVPWLPVNVLAALVILAAVTWVYALLLPFEGQLLQRRELTILKEVTEEIE